MLINLTFPCTKGAVVGRLSTVGRVEQEILWALSKNLSDINFRQAPKLGPTHRARLGTGLLELKTALDALNFPRTATANLVELAIALSELDDGIVRHFLKPLRTGSNVTPDDIWRARALLCIVADMMIDAGCSENAALDWIGKNCGYLQSALCRVPGDGFKRGTIRNWFKALKSNGLEGRVKPSESAKALFTDRHRLAKIALQRCSETDSNKRLDWLIAETLGEAMTAAARASTPEAIETFKKMRPNRKIEMLPATKAVPVGAYSTAFEYAK